MEKLRRSGIARAIIFVCVLLTWGSCGPEKIKGPDLENQPPVVDFVNIPTDGARFLSDTTIYWFGSDIDGYITIFRYAVIDSVVVGPDPVAYLAGIAHDDLPWIELRVTLEDSQTGEKIKFSADVRDPVRKYKASYLFLQAIDNKGARSKIVFRMFFKNNHFPDTHLYTRDISDPYVNTAVAGGILEGVSITWAGEDPIDYPRNPPPFEYRWKFYGPYDDSAMDLIVGIFTESVFVDIYGDFYRDCESYPARIRLDTFSETLIVPETTFIPVCDLPNRGPLGAWQERFIIEQFEQFENYRLVNESENGYTGGDWVSDVGKNFYDVYREYNLSLAAADGINPDTTKEMNFLFWCQARDDSKVPDPIPSYTWISVIDPKFEREVIIIDATRYGKSNQGFYNWPVFPIIAHTDVDYYDRDITDPMVRNVLGAMVNEWAGRDDAFDIDNIRDDEYYYEDAGRCRLRYNYYKATQDYYPISLIASENCSILDIYAADLREILKHKIILLIKDEIGGVMNWYSNDLLAVLDGLNAGMSCWAMVRAPFVQPGTTRNCVWGGWWQNVPHVYQQYFGVINMKYTAWAGAINCSESWNGARIEDFIGTYVLPDFSGLFEDLNIDTILLEERYLWLPGAPGFDKYDYRCTYCPGDPNSDGILVGALPEVEYIERSRSAEPIYLYKSLYGAKNPQFQQKCCRDIGHWLKSEGAVVAVRLDAGLFKTAHFSFSLLPIEQEQAQRTFNAMMDWLSEQPYLQAAKSASNYYTANAGTDIARLRQINKEMHRLKAQGLLGSIYNDL